MLDSTFMRYCTYSSQVQRERMAVARGWGEGAVGSFLLGTEFQFYKMKRIMEPDGSDGYITGICLMPLNSTLKNDYDNTFYIFLNTIKWLKTYIYKYNRNYKNSDEF